MLLLFDFDAHRSGTQCQSPTRIVGVQNVVASAFRRYQLSLYIFYSTLSISISTSLHTALLFVFHQSTALIVIRQDSKMKQRVNLDDIRSLFSWVKTGRQSTQSTHLMGESRERSDLRRWVGLWVGYSEMTMDGRLYRYMKVRVSLFLFSYFLKLWEQDLQRLHVKI